MDQEIMQKDAKRNAWKSEGAKKTFDLIVTALKSGKSFNEYMKQLPSEINVPNMLLGAPLIDQDFSKLNLRGISFDYSNLTGTNFHKSFLAESSFIKCDLQHARFDKAFLEKVIFGNSDLSNVDFSNAQLSEANFMGANLDGTDFSNAILDNANFFRAKNADKAIFTEADLSKVRFLTL